MIFKTFYLGVPAPPSGFPLYLCSLRHHLASKIPLVSNIRLRPNNPPLTKDAAPIPNATDELYKFKIRHKRRSIRC